MDQAGKGGPKRTKASYDCETKTFLIHRNANHGENQNQATSTNLIDVQLEYVAEGAANVVYSIATNNKASMPSELHLHLLRVRKISPHAVDLRICQATWESHFKPLLGDELVVSQQLVEIRSEVIVSLNRSLILMEERQARPTNRWGRYLDENEQLALLVQDMRGTVPINIEVKLKWLMQSPDAPPNAKRCRTCALHAKRTVTAGNKIRRSICPLALVCGSENQLTKTLVTLEIKSVLKAARNHRAATVGTGTTAMSARPSTSDAATNLPGERNDASINTRPETRSQSSTIVSKKPAEFPGLRRLMEFFKAGQGGSVLVQKLKDAQLRMLDECDNPQRDTQQPDPDLVLMTLRDCSLYLRVPINPRLPVEGRFGDLDLKSKTKRSQWKETEEELCRDGWYTKDLGVVHAQCALYQLRPDNRPPYFY